MSIPTLTFFNNKGGVGKTSLVYHLAWMLSDLDYRVLACDLPMAQEARKPIFHLKPADGAIGAHATAAYNASLDFKILAEKIINRIGIAMM